MLSNALIQRSIILYLEAQYFQAFLSKLTKISMQCMTFQIETIYGCTSLQFLILDYKQVSHPSKN